MDAYDLCNACKKGDLAAVKEAINSGISPNEAPFTDELPLVAAVRGGHEKIITYLLNNGAEIDLSEESGIGSDKGHSPLTAASFSGNLAIVELLLKRGASIDKCSKSKHSALFVAAKEGQSEVIDYLLENGASLAVTCGYQDRTALHEACAWFNTEAVKSLLNAGADVHALDNDGCSPLQLVCHPELKKGAAKEITSLLLGKDAKVNEADRFKRTPFIQACRWSPKAVVELLLDKGGDLQYVDEDGMTPLLAACHYNKDWQVAELLINAGADLNARNKEGRTPLHLAAYEDVDEKVVKALVEAGANTNCEDNNGETPLERAASSFYKDKPHCKNKAAIILSATKDLKDNKENKSAILEKAARSGDADLCREILKRGIEKNPRDEWQRTPLHWAAFDGHHSVVKVLLEQGCDYSLQDESGNTPLHLACKKQQKKVIQHLLQSGASPEIENNKNRTPLYYVDDKTKAFIRKKFSEFSCLIPNKEQLFPPNLKCKSIAKGKKRQCKSCGWQGEKDDEQRMFCPWCHQFALSQSNYEVLHGNPNSPAADTDVSFEYSCEHCGATFSSCSSAFSSAHTSISSRDVPSFFVSEDGGETWQRSWDWDE